MPGEVKRSLPKTKRRSLRAFSKKVFEESSVGVISTVAHTNSNSRKFFKVLVFLLCLSGFLYQSCTFLSVVFQYPTTVDIDVRRPDIFQVPGYTFCDNNAVNRRLFCEKYPGRCEMPSDEFCNKYHYYCGENKTMMPKKYWFDFHIDNDFEELVEMTAKKEEFILKYSRDGYEKITGPHFRMKDLPVPDYYTCYSANDRVNSSSYPVTYIPARIVRTPVDTFSFKVRSDENFLPGSRAGILFSVHSQFEAVNPFETGAFMKPGRTYMIYVSVEEEVLEKRPYDTDCINYTEIWENNDRTGPRLQEMCRHNCLSQLSKMCFRCNLPVFYFPQHEKFCSVQQFMEPDSTEEACNSDGANKYVEACARKCKNDCTYTKFRYTVQERYKPHFDEKGDTIPDIGDIINVEIYIEDDEVKVYKHSPKYMTVEAVSSIGGFIGIWLGMSLLDVAEIFESFIRIIKYSLKKI